VAEAGTRVASPAWYERRDAGFQDPVPHRHKFTPDVMRREIERARAIRTPHGGDVIANPNIPLFALHVTSLGAHQRFSYVESRVFYCCAYERLASATAQFARLCTLRETHGVSLEIAGYDGRPLTGATDDDLYADYCDAAVPYGHERALAALLLCHAHGQHAARELPWRRYMREHPQLYQGFTL
jgi:hypothetical protein